MHYLPRLRKLATRKKKQKPQLARWSQTLDFHTERTRSSTASCAAPSRPIDHGLGPPPIRERVAAAVHVPEGVRHWAENFPWRRALHAAIASAVIVGVCAAALIVAWKVVVHLRRGLHVIHQDTRFVS
ncbi:uncharacterized protein [Dermacentor albipictus]|uniref:uncharacterized protein isoform X2 n=1 Tax=Dermacentor albipictus TaxID=60249 RepID=UPI0038FC3E91